MRLTGVTTIAWRLGPDSCSSCRFFPHHATRSSRRTSVPSFTGQTPAQAANFRVGTHLGRESRSQSHPRRNVRRSQRIGTRRGGRLMARVRSFWTNELRSVFFRGD
jgi:hypothetical protein